MLRDPSLIPLSHQHQHGLALVVMTERSLAQDAGEANVAALASRAVERFDLELANHFEVEERDVFPLMPGSLLVRELIAEHRALEAQIAALRSGAGVDVLRQFMDLLRRHIRREENELFEQMQKTLSRETLDAMGKLVGEHVLRVCL